LKNIKAIDEKIKNAESEVAVLEAKRTELKKKIEDFERRKQSIVT